MNNILEKLNLSLARRVPIILQSEISECGLACINMIMNYYGNNISLLSLRNMFRLSSRGLDLEKLQKILESFKFESRALSLELEELNYLQIPCILHWDFDHFVVLTKVTNKYIYINDPAYGQK